MPKSSQKQSSFSTAISVVIPTYNGQSLLAKHLPAVMSVLRPEDEVIVVDDASTDDTKEWIEQQAKKMEQGTEQKPEKGLALRLVALPTNQRFAGAVNAGVEAATHPYVLLLNNDVHPLTPDIRQRLLEWFHHDPQLFAVGCGEVRKDAPEDEPQAQLFGRGTGGFQRGMFVHWYDPDQHHHDTLWTAGGSMMLDRAKFLKLGGFDTLFYPAYEEDRDLSYQALKHGYTIIFDYDSRVLHQHESTNQNIFGQRQMAINSWKNQWLFAWKNMGSLLMWLQHFFWLPYHLIVGGWRSEGASVLGLGRALRQLPQLVRSRRRAAQFWRRSDQEILQSYSFAKPPQE